ncbi:ScyD/ScyE family protein [Segeticoccus rhizosphaerae]|jgi:hypothetical protein|uniref:ScyD/ScyE family protein n=1 Tax=Segeticoccus rhizosphaerae TaxID=1104777 RepID=UPI00126431DB|nr:ScyD/ScyE family protein [Segeticoccus rhizosphaerae]
MSHKLKAATAVLAVSAMSIASAPMAQAHGNHGHWTKTLSTQVVAPFQLAVNHGDVYVADGGTSLVSTVKWNGDLRTVATGPQPGEVAGVALDPSGRSLAYTSTNYADGTTSLTIKRKGHRAVTADLSGWEQTKNPDRNRTYGYSGSDPCVIGVLEQMTGGPAGYTGVVDSHPYSVTWAGHGNWIVADAGGNDLLMVNKWGKVRTLKVLPAQPLTVTEQMADGLGMPACMVGVTYKFEPVPTDVEMDRHGMLWVSTLPGGPEDPSLGARGSVYKVNPWTKKATRQATGFLGATNLAVTGSGQVFVTELFGGQVSTIRHGKAMPYKKVANPLSIEAHGNRLYVGTMAPMDEQGMPTGNGSIIEIRR